MKALLVIDMQKEGVLDGYGTRQRMYNRKDVVNNIKLLIEKFNKKKYLVIQIKVWITDPKKTSMTKTSPGEGLASSPRSQIIDELRDLHYDYVVKKTNYTGFYGTNLDKILKKHKVKEVYLTGMNTGFCVLCTGLDAFYRGYDTFLVSDATSTVSGKRWHEKGLDTFVSFCGKKLITTKELLR